MDSLRTLYGLDDMNRDDSTALTAKASKLEAAVLRAAALRGQGALQAALRRDPSAVSRILSNQRGVHLNELEPFFDALGMRVVEGDADGFVTITREEHRALITLARKALSAEE